MTTQVKPPPPAIADAAAPAATPAAAAPPAVARKARKFTVAEYFRMAEKGILDEQERVELIDGEVLLMPPMGSVTFCWGKWYHTRLWDTNAHRRIASGGQGNAAIPAGLAAAAASGG